MNHNETKRTDPQEILVVDDDQNSRQLIKNVLKKAGYHIRSASNGNLALRSVKYKLPDLILLDVKMPDAHYCSDTVAGQT